MTKKKANYGKVSTAENFTPDEAPPNLAAVAGYRRRNAMTFEVQESATNSKELSSFCSSVVVVRASSSSVVRRRRRMPGVS